MTTIVRMPLQNLPTNATIPSESVVGKLVLVTGATSGIGSRKIYVKYAMHTLHIF